MDRDVPRRASYGVISRKLCGLPECLVSFLTSTLEMNTRNKLLTAKLQNQFYHSADYISFPLGPLGPLWYI